MILVTPRHVQVDLVVTDASLLLVDTVVTLLQIVRKIEDDGPDVAAQKWRDVDFGLLDDGSCRLGQVVQKVAEFGDPVPLVINTSLPPLQGRKWEGLEVEIRREGVRQTGRDRGVKVTEHLLEHFDRLGDALFHNKSTFISNGHLVR